MQRAKRLGKFRQRKMTLVGLVLELVYIIYYAQ